MSTTSPTTTTTTTTTRTTTTTLAKTSRVLLLVEKAANFSFATNMAGVAKFSVYLLFTDSTTTSDKKSGKSVALPAPSHSPSTAPAHNSHGYPCGPMANYKLFTSVYEFAICSAHFCQPWSPENALTFSCINRALNRARAPTLWANFSTLLFALTFSSIQGHARWWKVDREMATNRRKR